MTKICQRHKANKPKKTRSSQYQGTEVSMATMIPEVIDTEEEVILAAINNEERPASITGSIFSDQLQLEGEWTSTEDDARSILYPDDLKITLSDLFVRQTTSRDHLNAQMTSLEAMLLA
jgi:hypothetical protein